MKICLVTAFPPSRGGLSEYGLHIAQELQQNPFLSLTILADRISPAQPELQGFAVQRCWSFDSPASAIHILRAIHRLKPDVVWFNLLFSTFGRNPLVAFFGLMTPLLARLTGRYTHVTLHHLIDAVDLQDAGVRYARTYRWAGAVATRILLLSNSVSVLMPGYREILAEKYGGSNVHVRSHGILTRRPEAPDFSRRGNPQHRILAFGKWGTYKRLELMIDAFKTIAQRVPSAKLVIGGGNHPQAPGYVESVREEHAGDARIEFRGYVHEDALPSLFQTSSVAVMPYSSSTGCSGVAHLACAYGVPIVCADLPDFRQMTEGEELAIEFFQSGSAQDLADALVRILENPGKQRAMATQNFSAALRMTMPNIVQKYLRHFELQQRTEALKYVTRFRRLPDWVPSKSLLLRAITRDALSWVHRSAIPRARAPLNHRNGHDLPNGNGDGRRELVGGGYPVNGNGIGARGIASATRGASQADSDQATEGKGSDRASAVHAAAYGNKPDDPERQQQGRVEGTGAPHRPMHPGNGNSGNGESGSRDTGAGSNGDGREEAAQSGGETGTGERDGIVEGPGLGLGSDGEGP